MNGQRWAIVFFLAAVMMWLSFFSVANVHAQTPTETPTPTVTATPNQYPVTLSSGDQLFLERRITYGEIAIVIALGVLIVVWLIGVSALVMTKWLR